MKSISNTLVAAIFAVVVTLVVGVFSCLPFGRAFEGWMGDKMMSWRYELGNGLKPDPHLVLVEADQNAVNDLGRWPFPRGIHAQLLQVLAPEKPKVVTWDVFFTEYTAASPTDAAPTETPAPDGTTPAPAPAGAAPKLQPDDQELVEAAKLFPHFVSVAESTGNQLTPEEQKRNENILPTRPLKNVVGDASRIVSVQNAVLPIPELRQASYFGFADFDANNVNRTVSLVINVGGKILPSLALQTLLQYWDVDPDKVTINLGREVTLPRPDGTLVHIPIDGSGRFTVNYRARQHDFQWISYGALGKGLADKANNEASEFIKALPPLKDNIVVLGVALDGIDNGTIPIDAYSPLVVAQINVMNNILQGDYLGTIPIWGWLPLYAIFLFAIGAVMLRVMNQRFGIVRMALVALGAMLLTGAVSFIALVHGNLQVPVAMPELGLLVLAIMVPTKGFFGEEQEKKRFREALSANVSEKVMIKMLEHPDNLKLGGEKRIITVMFCDVRNFTTYCDNRDSAEVMEVLNEYMEEMTQVVHKYDGTVDKYIGDCIMAFWNAPNDQADHAQQAVCCAMEMRYALANFKTKRAGKDIELFECGIGIHTGEALVGMMGSSIKRGYTAMGSTVNLGARLEALTKRLNERILISQQTRDQLQGDFPLTDRGEATVPGFATPIHVYAIGAEQDLSAALKIGRTIASQQEYTAEEVEKPIWAPAPLPEDADPNG